jgi:hypothetical protein
LRPSGIFDAIALSSRTAPWSFPSIRPRCRPSLPPIDFRAALNDEQYTAVTAEPGPLLVLAGAGSGKTRTLTYRVAYLLSQGVRPGEILLLTFTNKAAKEMLHRVYELTGVEPGRFWGGTFHSIGHRALRMHGEAIGLNRSFTIMDAEESEGLLRDAVEAADKGFFKDKTHPRPGPLHAILSMARNTQFPLDETVTRFFPQHEDIGERLPLFAPQIRRGQTRGERPRLRRPARELARAAAVARLRPPPTSHTASAMCWSTSIRTPTRCSRRSSI